MEVSKEPIAIVIYLWSIVLTQIKTEQVLLCYVDFLKAKKTHEYHFCYVTNETR